jgi:hypothetical protein
MNMPLRYTIIDPTSMHWIRPTIYLVPLSLNVMLSGAVIFQTIGSIAYSEVR